MSVRTDLLIVGAGPYAYAAAACARRHGIDTHITGRPMAFWRDQMPADMFLRSGVNWHLDAAEEDTFAAYFEDCALDPSELDPIPLRVFLDYTEWFRRRQSLTIDERLVVDLVELDGSFVATMEDGSTVTADKVLAAPGVRHFASRPAWYADVAPDRCDHTSERVAFDDLAGARVLIVGGRQSAYEWAALLCDHGAERVDVVHRHSTPAFAKVSWAFVDPYVAQTLDDPGWWRGLPAQRKQEIAAEFWRVGRLTLEPWLVPRIRREVVTSHPSCEVMEVAAGADGLTVSLSDGAALGVDHVILASGYQADLAQVPYLSGVKDRVSVTDGFPDLTEGFETSLPGLYVTGFASTRDFGPFYGFTKGCPSAAQIAVTDMLG